MTGSTSVELSDPRQRNDRDEAVTLLAAVADPVRWTVLRRLVAGTACVCDLQDEVDVPANLLSYHLKVLRESGLVTTSRRGRWVDYTLAADAAARLRAALPAGQGGRR